MSTPILSINEDPARTVRLREEIDGKNILVTGGTGSYGGVLIRTLIFQFNPKKVVVFSRDELKQSVMSEKLSDECAKAGQPDLCEKVRFFIGDIRDQQRLIEAFQNVDLIFHAAALKQVPALEYNPFEAIKTNVLGANNVISAAFQSGVKKIIALSTDKAACPVNLYGATKLCQDKLMVAANNMYPGIKIGVVRYGNVFGSRGSVVPFFHKQKETGRLTVTDERMTRFTITLEEGVAFSMNCLAQLQGGEIFIPKIASYKIGTVADAIGKPHGCKVDVIGIRPGEKLHEVMVPEDEAANTIEFADHFIITPPGPWWQKRQIHYLEKGGKFCKHGFEYSSGNNNNWVDEKYIEDQLVAHGYRGDALNSP